MTLFFYSTLIYIKDHTFLFRDLGLNLGYNYINSHRWRYMDASIGYSKLQKIFAASEQFH